MRTLAWLGGAILFALMIGISFVLLGGPGSTAAEAGPDILIDPPFVIIDSADEQKEATVRIRNVGQAPVRLLSITSSCGCTVPGSPEREVLDPGQETPLRIRGTPPGSGQKTSYVQIETNSPSTRWVRVNLLLKGKTSPVPRIVRIPDTIALHSYRQHKETISSLFEVETVELAGSEFWLKTTPAVSSRLTIQSQPPVELPGSEPTTVSRKYKFEISGVVDPQQSWDDKIVIEADRIQKTIRVVAQYVPRIKFVPNTLFFDLSSENADHNTRTVSLIRSEEVPVPEITVLPTEHDWLRVRQLESQEPGSSTLAKLEISLSQVPASTERTARSSVQVRTSDPDCPSLELPIVIRNANQ